MRHNKTASAKYETYIIMTCKTSAKLRPSVIETADRAYPSRETNPSVGTSSHATGWRVVMYFWRLACGYSILEDAEISQFHNKIWRKFASFPKFTQFYHLPFRTWNHRLADRATWTPEGRADVIKWRSLHDVMTEVHWMDAINDAAREEAAQSVKRAWRGLRVSNPEVI